MSRTRQIQTQGTSLARARDAGFSFPLPGERPAGWASRRAAAWFLFAFLQAHFGPPGLRSRRGGARSSRMGRDGRGVRPRDPAPESRGGRRRGALRCPRCHQGSTSPAGRLRWRARDPVPGGTRSTAERARSPSSAPRRRAPGLCQSVHPPPCPDVTRAPAALPPCSAGLAPPPTAPPCPTWALFLFGRRSCRRPACLERVDSTDLGQERRVSRPGAVWCAQEGGPRSGLCLDLPGLVQSRAASLSGRADPGRFRDFAGALEPSPGEEEAGSPRDLLAPSKAEPR